MFINQPILKQASEKAREGTLSANTYRSARLDFPTGMAAIDNV